MKAAPGYESTGAASTTLAQLRTMVREVLQLPEPEDDGDGDRNDMDTRPLRELGAGSLHTVALQFRILQETSVNLEIAELVGGASLADLAALIDTRRPAPA